MTLCYEIHCRQANEPHPGHLGLKIEGLDVDLTVEPGQFLPKALREATAEGKAGAELAMRAEEICQSYARKAIQRRIDRLKTGLVPESIKVAGGLPADDAALIRAAVSAGKSDTELLAVAKQVRRGFRSGGIMAGTASELASVKRLSEEESVEKFLNRGTLKGLDKPQRQKRMQRRAEKIDNDRDWLERRQKLIAECEAELARWEVELAKWDGSGLPPKAEKMVAVLRDRLAGLRVRVLAASHGFQYAYTQYLTAAIQLATDDIRIWPLMTTTSLDTVRDAVDTFSDVTIGEFDGANYSSGGLALDSQAVAVDDANDRAEFDAADEAVSALGAGSASIQGVAVGKFNTNTNGSLPLHWIEFSSNKTPDGSDFTFVFNAEGIIQAADG